MRRDLARLSDAVYDVAIIGGGIYGVCAAWDAASRGLSVALLDKGDFGQATSANSLRIIHGGLRYLQHLDFQRMRRANRERTIWMRIAPHLVHPLPILVPTYGHWTRGREVLWAALRMNDLIGFDRNRLQDPEKYIPKGRIISRNECLRMVPGIDETGLTGGALWYDGQMSNSERLILAVLRSASDAGADAANYVEVTGFITEGGRVTGLKATDLLHAGEIDIRAKVVVNTGGPWVDKVLSLQNRTNHQRVRLSKAMNVVTRPLVQNCAVGLRIHDRKSGSNGSEAADSRLLFFTPWRQHTLVGTFQAPYSGDPDDFEVNEDDIREFVAQINSAFPVARLWRKDISFLHSGLVPMEHEGRGLSADLARRYRIYNHSSEEGLEGLISVISVKFTEARYVSEELVDLVFEKLGKKSPRTLTRSTPVHGGDIESFGDFLSREKANRPKGLTSEVTEHLVYNYGAEYSKLLEYFDENPAMSEPISPGVPVIKAEIVQGIREEMAQTLSDMVFRRTDLARAGDPGDDCLTACAGVMAQEAGWNEARVRQEVCQVKRALASHCYA